MKWFVNGEPTDYTGGRTTPDIVNWINKRSGPPTKKVTGEALDTQIEQNQVTIVFFGSSESPEFTHFEKAAGLDDK